MLQLQFARKPMRFEKHIHIQSIYNNR